MSIAELTYSYSVFYDTNIGARIIVPVYPVTVPLNDISGYTLDRTDFSEYLSALISQKGETIITPVTVGSNIKLLKDNEEIGIELFRSDSQSNNIHIYNVEKQDYPFRCYTTNFSSDVWTGAGFIIMETGDGYWIPIPQSDKRDGSFTSIIPCTLQAFGNIDITGGISSGGWSAPSDALIDTGYKLKYGQTPIPDPDTDPYNPLPPSDPGGGDGDFDFDDSDPIDFPDEPELSAVSTGFVSLWSPDEDQMLSLASYMWNADILTINFWKKLIADPLDLIYGLSLVPLNLDSLGYIDGQGTVVVGLIDTGIWMNHLSSQWVTFDCGSIDISEAWGAYLDYDPYTKLEIYLPFCGIHPLKIDDFMPGQISLVYKIDLLSGTCVAIVKSTKSNKHGDVLNSVVYQFMGNCAAQIPVTSQQFADAVRSAINIAASIGSMVATGVGGAAAIGDRKGAKKASAIARTVSGEISGGASVVENVMGLKPGIERSGAIGSAGSLLSVRTPYLIFTRPRMARPEKQNVYTGYPSFITETLGELNGWTIVQAIHLDNIPCTADEMTEIDELLKGGVIF